MLCVQGDEPVEQESSAWRECRAVKLERERIKILRWRRHIVPSWRDSLLLL